MYYGKILKLIEMHYTKSAIADNEWHQIGE